MSALHINPVRRILVATDLSEESASAARLARHLSHMLQAELHGIHVIPEPSKAQTRALPDLAPRLAKDSAPALKQFALEHTIHDRVTWHTIVGHADAEIVRLAASLKADLIIIGRHGHSGRAARTIGSIAERVVRRSPVSVAVAHASFAEPITRLAAASTCEEDTAIEIERTLDLAARLGIDRVGLLKAFDVPHGYHLVSSYDDAAARLSTVHSELASDQVSAARAHLNSAVNVDIETRLGPPVETLSTYARDAGLDLLVIRTHNRTAPAEVLLDRISERIITHAECSIWAEKSPAETQSLLDIFRHLLD